MILSDADGVTERRGSIAATSFLEAQMLQPTHIFSRSIGLWLILLFVSLVSARAEAQVAQAVPPPGEEGLVRRGDAVVTGFAATLPPGPDLPIDVHPLDRTTIDPESATVRIFDLTQLGGGPEGQLSDAPVRHVIKAKDVGHVFGIAFDGDGSEGSGPPNLYLTATSVHGLQLLAPGADGKLERVMTGRQGAQWMPGLFGGAKGSPGSIWKVDGRTGAVTLFADIRNGDLENSGAGLGAIAFDARSRSLYVSDLETGLIWRLGLDGTLIDAFDHGTEGRSAGGLPMAAYDPATRTDRTEETFNTEEPETWGFAAPERRVWGLAIENNRLYYAVADGPTIWSVGLEPDGRFSTDARVEVGVTGTPAGTQISTILFDGPGRMYLAQRGTQLGSYDYQTFMRPQEATSLRYQWDEQRGRWIVKPEEYAVGLTVNHHAAVGGLAFNYGYDRFGQIDYGRCRQTLWLTGEHLRAGSDIVRVARGGPSLVAGLQGIYKSRVRPDNSPPFEAWYVDYDADYADEEAYGHIGNVGIFAPCKSSVTYSAERVEIPVWTKGPNLVVDKRCEPVGFGGRVRCVIVVRNIGDATGEGPISIIDETRTLWGPAAGSIISIAEAAADGIEWACATNPSGAYACTLPASLLPPGGSRELSVWVDTRDLVLGGGVGFRNCARIDHPNGKGKACAEGGTGLIVSKTGPTFCPPGQGCTFTLTLTNASPLPYKGNVLLTDHMLAGDALVEAPITKIEPALSCSDQPAKLPFSCLAAVELAAGESLAHKITVTMPGPGPVFVQNCFAATAPWLAGKPDLLAGLLLPAKFQNVAKAALQAHPSCHWVQLAAPPLASPAKAPQPQTAGSFIPTDDTLPPVPLCADGRPPRAGGRCACPLNAPWDAATGTCRSRPVCWDTNRLTPSGRCCPRGTVWWASTGVCRTPPVTGCRDASRRTPDGSCCPRGETWRDGQCRPQIVDEPCGFGFRRLLSGQCIPLPVIPPVVVHPKCPDGRDRLRNGRCPPVACPFNAPYNPRTGRCQPSRGPICGPGLRGLPHSGRCVPIGNAGCPGRLVRDPSGKCMPPPYKGDGRRPGKPPHRADPPKRPHATPDDRRKRVRDRIRERARDRVRERREPQRVRPSSPRRGPERVRRPRHERRIDRGPRRGPRHEARPPRGPKRGGPPRRFSPEKRSGGPPFGGGGPRFGNRR